MKILIADDSRLTRLTLRKLLIHLGLPDMEILEAGDGHAAIHIALSRKPDLMFLDLLMPEPDGFAVLEKLKAGGYAGFVVVLTSNIQEPVRNRVVHELGAHHFVDKPINEAKLAQALSAFERHRAASPSH